ncbi:hypothetical protein BKA66DRAFT_69237 [Pyrenochaeta sp. MPI-SDFR-AT-0127]|nr:hypothetical protein BKA66DRAFT_69237 [Pyrenochaeta sp. MPI-SDFR-AT-0127]
MLSTERDERPTAIQIRGGLAAHALKLFSSTGETCRVCNRDFISKNGLHKHLRKTGHSSKGGLQNQDTRPANIPNEPDQGLTIRGAANTPTQYYYENGDIAEFDGNEPPPCVVCWKSCDSKQKLFQHIYCGQHVRRQRQVLKRLADSNVNLYAETHHDKRLMTNASRVESCKPGPTWGYVPV